LIFFYRNRYLKTRILKLRDNLFSLLQRFFEYGNDAGNYPIIVDNCIEWTINQEYTWIDKALDPMVLNNNCPSWLWKTLRWLIVYFEIDDPDSHLIPARIKPFKSQGKIVFVRYGSESAYCYKEISFGPRAKLSHQSKSGHKLTTVYFSYVLKINILIGHIARSTLLITNKIRGPS